MTLRNLFALTYVCIFLVTLFNALGTRLTYLDVDRNLPCEYPGADQWEALLAQENEADITGPKTVEFLDQWYYQGWKRSLSRFGGYQDWEYEKVQDLDHELLGGQGNTDRFASSLGWRYGSAAIKKKLNKEPYWEFQTGHYSISPQWLTLHLSTLGAIILFAWYYRSANPIEDH